MRSAASSIRNEDRRDPMQFLCVHLLYQRCGSTTVTATGTLSGVAGSSLDGKRYEVLETLHRWLVDSVYQWVQDGMGERVYGRGSRTTPING